MKIIALQLYTFDELSEEVQKEIVGHLQTSVA